MTPETRRLASAAIDASISGDPMKKVCADIALFEAHLAYATGISRERIERQLREWYRWKRELEARESVSRYGY